MKNKRVADVLVGTLMATGVKNVYGLAGDFLSGITDSIRIRRLAKVNATHSLCMVCRRRTSAISRSNACVVAIG